MEPKKKGILYWIVATLLILLWLLPILAAMLVSLKSIDELNSGKYWTFPETIQFQNYVEAFMRADFDIYFWNSVVITVPTVAVVAFLASMSGYALAKLRFRGREALSIMFMAGMLLPFQILLIPVFYISNNILNTYDTRLGVILFHIAFQLGFATFFMTNFVKTIPNAIIDAARIDGCSEWTIYFRIILPLMIPSIAAISTLLFTWIWNDYLWALVLIKSNELKPITAGLANMKGRFEAQYHIQSAAALVAALPPVVVFAFLQKHFIRGMTSGSVKG